MSNITGDPSPLRIVHIVEAALAGVGRHVIDLALSSARAGLEVHVMYSELRMDSAFVLGLEKLEEMGVRATRVIVQRGPAISDLWAILQIRRYLRSEGPFDVVHCHSTKGGVVGRLATIGITDKVVYTPNAFLTMAPRSDGLSRFVARPLEAILSRITKALICVSDEEYLHAISLGISRDILLRVPNGIDPLREDKRCQRLAIRRTFGLKDNELCIGFVGRFVPQKAPSILIEAFALATQKINRPVRLVMVGEGPLLTAATAQASRLNLTDHIVFAGQMEGLLAMTAFDIFALPSTYEGFPYVLIEALVAGLPIVSTLVGGAIEMTRTSGYVVPVNNVYELAAKLSILAEDDRLREQMASAALRTAPFYSLNQMFDATVAIYKEMAGRSIPTAEVIRDHDRTAVSQI